MALLKWKVSEKPTGRYKSFQTRFWPFARYAESGEPAAQLLCEHEYDPQRKEDCELRVMIASWDQPQGFLWKLLKRRAYGLTEAKSLAEHFLAAHPEYQPNLRAALIETGESK